MPRPPPPRQGLRRRRARTMAMWNHLLCSIGGLDDGDVGIVPFTPIASGLPMRVVVTSVMTAVHESGLRSRMRVQQSPAVPPW